MISTYTVGLLFALLMLPTSSSFQNTSLAGQAEQTMLDAARFLLRMYVTRLDPRYKPALDKAIDFVQESQYPIGGWPQRYPLRHDFVKTQNYTHNGRIIQKKVPDYASMNPLVLHIAFISEDLDADYKKLEKVGTTLVDHTHLDDGSHITMMRDPWGFSFQLCKRRTPMVK